MFQSIEMIGSDLKWRSTVISPTLKIAEMMIAGE
jgi:predicted Zn-dependent protease